MKKIEAIIKPYKLDIIKTALAEVGVDAMTATDVRYVKTARSRSGCSFNGGLQQPKMKVEVFLIDDLVEVALSAIVGTMKSARSAEGEVFVSSITDAIGIRTGDHGNGVVAHIFER